MKTIKLFLTIFILSIMVGCSDGSVNIVENSAFPGYTATIGDSFSAYYSDVSWESVEKPNGATYVVATCSGPVTHDLGGYSFEADTHTWTFAVDNDKNIFKYESLAGHGTMSALTEKEFIAQATSEATSEQAKYMAISLAMMYPAYVSVMKKFHTANGGDLNEAGTVVSNVDCNLTEEIVTLLMDELEPKAVCVYMEDEHLCISSM